ncbi:MAG TPA: hypothetical protein VF196_03515, partial [Casimicrobiaceae bacterium]
MPDNESRTAKGHAARDTLAQLAHGDAFVARHLGSDPADQDAMLRTLGFATRQALIEAVVPAAIRASTPLPLP